MGSCCLPAGNFVTKKLPRIKDCKLEYFNIGSGGVVEGTVKIIVYNPGACAVPIREVTCFLKSNGSVIATGQIEEEKLLKPKATENVAMKITIRYCVIACVLWEVLNKTQWELDYQVDLRLVLARPICGNDAVVGSMAGKTKLPQINAFDVFEHVASDLKKLVPEAKSLKDKFQNFIHSYIE